MGDQFEKFIRENRGEFEVESRRSAAERWEVIETKVQRKNHGPIFWKVAAVLFLASTSLLLVDRFFSTSEQVPISNRYQEFQQAEAFYTSMINEKRVEIEAHNLDGLSLSFLSEVNQLDDLYAQLKETFDQSVNDQQIMDAMIRNLQLRIEILNQQLKILETLKSVKNETVQNG